MNAELRLFIACAMYAIIEIIRKMVNNKSKFCNIFLCANKKILRIIYDPIMIISFPYPYLFKFFCALTLFCYYLSLLNLEKVYKYKR